MPMSVRNRFSPMKSKNARPAGSLVNAMPPRWPGADHECSRSCQLRSTARRGASTPTIASPSSNDSERTTSQLRAASAAAMLSAARPIAVSGRASASSTTSTRGRIGPAAGVSIGLLPAFLFHYAIDQVTAPAAFDRLEAQAVDVGLEAGELGVELACVQQVVVDRLCGFGQALAGHDHRDARLV